MKTENITRKKIGKREYLTNQKTRYLMAKLNAFFESKVEVPRLKVGKEQSIETLINEEALLSSKYFRNERKEWNPRFANLSKLVY